MGKWSGSVNAECYLQCLGASRKSELAINYASKVRTYSPDTWVFWLCATTTQKFKEDLEAVADILPGSPRTNDSSTLRNFALNWLCSEEGERWLMVVDDVNPVFEVWIE